MYKCIRHECGKNKRWKKCKPFDQVFRAAGKSTQAAVMRDAHPLCRISLKLLRSQTDRYVVSHALNAA